MAYLIRIRHSRVAKLALIGLGLFAVTAACDDPYNPDRWLPGD